MNRRVLLHVGAFAALVSAVAACSQIPATPPVGSPSESAQNLTGSCTWKPQKISGIGRGDVFSAIAIAMDGSGSYSSSSSSGPSITFLVGTYATAKTALAFWDVDGHWTKQIVVNPSLTLNRFFSVAALSKTDAWAVGEYFSSSNVYEPLMEHWDGHRWRMVMTPVLSHGGILTSVHAYSSSNVWASGAELGTSTSGFKGLLLNWNGKEWSKVDYRFEPRLRFNWNYTNAPFYLGSPRNAPLITTIDRDVAHVTIGGVAIAPKQGAPLEIYDFKPPKGYTTTFATGVTHFGSSGALAIGFAEPAPGTTPLLALSGYFNGNSYRWLPTPTRGVGASLLSVAYDSKVGGLAVGAYDATPKVFHPFALGFDGKAWRTLATPNLKASYTFVSRAGASNFWVAGGTSDGYPLLDLAKCTKF